MVHNILRYGPHPLDQIVRYGPHVDFFIINKGAFLSGWFALTSHRNWNDPIDLYVLKTSCWKPFYREIDISVLGFLGFRHLVWTRTFIRVHRVPTASFNDYGRSVATTVRISACSTPWAGIIVNSIVHRYVSSSFIQSLKIQACELVRLKKTKTSFSNLKLS